MALAESTLSKVCDGFADYIQQQLILIQDTVDSSETIQVIVGNPAEAEKAAEESTTIHLVNLFFYYLSFENTTFGLQLKVSCFITPYPKKDSIPIEKNDIRLLGQILKILENKPIILLDEIDKPVHLQIIPQTLDMQEASYILGMQQSANYRPSVSYGLSFIPIDGVTAVLTPPVGNVEVNVVNAY